MKARLIKALEKQWQQPTFIGKVLLSPWAGLYYLLITWRRSCYRLGICQAAVPELPVAVIGNLQIGGTGKTPQILALVRLLKDKGVKVGVISRGYGRNSKGPLLINPKTTTAATGGDEPLLIARRTLAPVAVDSDRLRAVRCLKNYVPDLTLVLSDDGLQHYALQAAVKITVFPYQDLSRNLYLLPVGPLREPLSILKNTDYLILTGTPARKLPVAGITQRLGVAAEKIIYSADSYGNIYSLHAPERKVTPDFFRDKKTAAAAAIANPHRFFNGLRQLGIIPAAQLAFPDHQKLPAAQLAGDFAYVIITEKDAVKINPGCAAGNIYVLPMEVKLTGAVDRLLSQLTRLTLPA